MDDEAMTYPPERWEAVRDWVRPRMLRKGWTQLDLAAAADVSPETARPFTTGKPAKRSPATTARIAIALDEPGDAIERILLGEVQPRREGDALDVIVGELGAIREMVQELLDRVPEPVQPESP